MATGESTSQDAEMLQEAHWVADMLPKVVEVFDRARHQFDQNITAVDLLNTAQNVLTLSQFDDDHALTTNGTMWHSGTQLAESGDPGVRAVGVLLQVSALASQPDVVAVLLQRLHDRLGGALLDV